MPVQVRLSAPLRDKRRFQFISEIAFFSDVEVELNLRIKFE